MVAIRQSGRSAVLWGGVMGDIPVVRVVYQEKNDKESIFGMAGR